jgi:hypothetical protein
MVSPWNWIRTHAPKKLLTSKGALDTRGHGPLRALADAHKAQVAHASASNRAIAELEQAVVDARAQYDEENACLVDAVNSARTRALGYMKSLDASTSQSASDAMKYTPSGPASSPQSIVTIDP